MKAISCLASILQHLNAPQLTHDSNDKPSVEWLNSNTEQEKADGDLGEADGEEVHWLGDKVELERSFEVFHLNVLDVLSSAVVDFWYDKALSCNTLNDS
jgi:hypothetical protein